MLCLSAFAGRSQQAHRELEQFQFFFPLGIILTRAYGLHMRTSTDICMFTYKRHVCFVYSMLCQFIAHPSKFGRYWATLDEHCQQYFDIGIRRPNHRWTPGFVATIIASYPDIGWPANIP